MLYFLLLSLLLFIYLFTFLQQFILRHLSAWKRLTFRLYSVGHLHGGVILLRRNQNHFRVSYIIFKFGNHSEV